MIAAGLWFAWAGGAYGGITTTNLQGGANWLSTTDGLVATQWNGGNVAPGSGIAAFAPYANFSTTTLNPNGMMWYCDPATANCATQAEDGTGPEEVFFARQFDIKPGALVAGAFAIIADDFVRLQINGDFVFDAILDSNKDANNQPVPLIFDITGFDLALRSGNPLDLGTLTNVLQSGTNTLVIQAMDGDLIAGAAVEGDDCVGTEGNGKVRPIPNGRFFCRNDRLKEYAFVQGSITVVPEPATLLLLGIGIAGLAAARQQNRS